VNLRQRLFRCISHFLGGVQEPWYTYLNTLANGWILFRHPEKKTCRGTLNGDKTIYLIRDLTEHVGLAGWYDRVLGYMLRAQKKGWVPVVAPPGEPDSARGDWYTYFKGVSPISVADALRSACVVEATVHGAIHKRYSPREIWKRHEIARRIALSDEASEYVDLRVSKVFSQMPRPCVGVMFRGTDYRQQGECNAVGHARVPRLDWFCERVASCLDRWGLDSNSGENLFVVTEEQAALDYIRERFQGCRYVCKERFVDFDFSLGINAQSLPNTSPRENNYLYLVDILALSKCDYLIGGINGCVLMALNLNGNKYRDVEIINTGVN